MIGAGGLSTSATSLSYSSNSDGTGVADQTNAGTYYVTAHYAGDANHTGSDGAAVAITINKASSTTTTVGAGPFTYTGSAQVGGSGAVAGAGGLSTSATSLSYSANSDGTGVADQTDAGTYYVTAHYAGDANHTVSDGSAVAITINKASSTTTTVGAGLFTYSGSAQVGGSGTVIGANLSISASSLTYSANSDGTGVADQTDAGTYYVTAHYAGDANHTASDGAAVAITINKASSTTTTVGAGPFTYTGSTQVGGSGAVTGVGGLSTGASSLTYTGDQIDAGTCYVTAHYAGDANHLPSDGAPVPILINQASSTTTATGGAFTYDGATHGGGSAVVSGAGVVTGSAVLSYAGDQVDAGSYTVTAAYAGDANHIGSSSTATITIGKAASSVTATGASFTYDGDTHTGGSAIVSGAGIVTGSAVLSYTGDQIDAGSYTVNAAYAGDANHIGNSGSATITIGKASSTTTTGGAGPFGYDGSTHTGGSGTVSGAGTLTGSATLSYTGDQIDAGTYYVTAHYAGDANHTGSDGAAVAITINKASSTTTTVGAGPFTYTGMRQVGGSGTVTGAGGLSASATSVTYSANSDGTGVADQTDAGAYYVTAYYAGDANHTASDGSAVAITINKASSTTTTVGAPVTYNGSAQVGGSGTVIGADGLSTSATSVTYSANNDGTGVADQTDAGAYYVTAHYAGDANHTASDGAAVAITINKASSTTTTVGAAVHLHRQPQVGGSGTVIGAGGLNTSATSVTYSANSDGTGVADQTDAGAYYVTAYYAGDANHLASDGSALAITICKASSTTTTAGAARSPTPAAPSWRLGHRDRSEPQHQRHLANLLGEPRRHGSGRPVRRRNLLRDRPLCRRRQPHGQ